MAKWWILNCRVRAGPNSPARVFALSEAEGRLACLSSEGP